jgi:hypothetical protein
MRAVWFGFALAALQFTGGIIYAAGDHGADGVMVMYAGLVVALLCLWSLLAETCIEQALCGFAVSQQSGFLRA